MKKTCTKCNEKLDLDSFCRDARGAYGRKSVCRACFRIYARDHYAKNKEKKAGYRRKSYLKKKAKGEAKTKARKRQHAIHQRVYVALKEGVLQKAPCMICGNESKIHAHHDNYERPIDVVWLCPLHHQERHKSLENWNAA